MTKQALALITGATVVLSGCATAPMDHAVERTQTFVASKDVVWERAVSFFAQRNLSIKTIEKSSGLIAADRSITTPVEGLEGYADCGVDPLTRRSLQTIDLNLFVRALPNGSTSVTVNTHFSETRMLGYNAMTIKTVTCTSTGKLEQMILEALSHDL